MNTKYKLAVKQLYDYTGKCSTCEKPLWERDREYAVYKFGRETCALHSGSLYWTNKAKESLNPNV